MEFLCAALIGISAAVIEQLFLAHREKCAGGNKKSKANADEADCLFDVQQRKDRRDAK